MKIIIIRLALWLIRQIEQSTPPPEKPLSFDEAAWKRIIDSIQERT